MRRSFRNNLKKKINNEIPLRILINLPGGWEANVDRSKKR
jgi:hypothetical protein